jgi:hypothetical protein
MATDAEIRAKGFLYIPKQKYLQNPFNLPIAPVPPPASGGITNTNAFVNSGGGGEIRYDNSFLPDPPTFNYVDTVAMYGADSPQAQKMLEKAGGTYPGGFQSNEGGFEYTNSFPDNSIQMQDLNYNPNVSSTGNVLSNYNRMDGYLDEGSQITGNTVGVGTGSPITNIKGPPSIMSSPGVRTIKGDLSTVANPEIFDSYGTSVKDPQVGDVGFENYSESAFEEEEDKKGFISNMISRAKQIGSSLPAWANAAATAIGGPLSVAANLIGIGTSNTSPSYQQFNPAGTLKGGVYTIDGVNYANPGQVNDFYDSNPDSDTFGTDRFDRAKKGSFASFRTLSAYLNRDKGNDGDDTNNDTNNDTNSTGSTDTSENTQGGYSCFIAGTKITMSDGTLKNIENIVVGDKVKGHKNDNEVIKLDPTLLANRKLYSFNNNEHYFFTSEHPFMTEEGWKSIKPEKTKERDGVELYNQLKGELKIGDKLVTDKGLIEITDIKSKEINKPDMPLYNFNVSNDNSYIADGYVVHNKGGNSGDTESQTNSQAGVGGFADYAKGGRAGYFFGGRVNFKYGGLASIL